MYYMYDGVYGHYQESFILRVENCTLEGTPVYFYNKVATIITP